MDVRCEKCQTEYELDEARVTEAGVTVKCTTCGNLFKVRRKGASQVAKLPPGSSNPNLPSLAGDERQWMVRNPAGVILKFKELTQLQRWIVERKVSRECEISRSGETWKRLGEIAELASFFQIVEKAESSRPPEPPRRATQPFGVPTPATTMQGQGAAPGLPQPPPPATAQRKPASPLAAAPTLLAQEPPRVTGTPPQAVAAESSGPRAPARAGNLASSLGGDEPSGPVGGLKGAPTVEPGWASGADAVRRTRAHMGAEGPGAGPPDLQAPMTDDDYDQEFAPRRSKAPWIALGALVLLGAGAGGYLLLFGEKKSAAVTEVTPVAADAGAAVDAATTDPLVQSMPDAAVVPLVPATPAVEAAFALLYDDTDEAFEAAERAFEAARTPDAAQDAKVLAGLALVNSTWAQYLSDDAGAIAEADKRRAEQLRAEANRRITRARKFADDSLARSPGNPDGLVAKADALRQTKAKAGEIEKLLAGAKEHPEFSYVKGMLRLRDRKVPDAKTLLHAAADGFRAKAGREHLRALYRLAQVAIAEKRTEDAAALLAQLLAAQPAHARGKVLIDKLAAAGGEPVAPVAIGEPKEPAGPKEPRDDGPVSAEQYDGLVAKGDKLAENSNCDAAMKQYERALEARPSGVEALTGLGFCHLEKKDYERALRHFRSALGISSRYADALWGMAETYKSKGDPDNAIVYYQKYLDAHPSGRMAAGARRNLEALQAGGKVPEPPPPEPEEPKDPPPPDPAKDPPKDPPPEEPKPDPPAEPPPQ